MKQIKTLFYRHLMAAICLTSLFACSNAEKKANEEKAIKQKSITRDFQSDINALLPSGEYTLDIMDKIKMSPRRQELQSKFMQAVKSNPDWFLEQQKQLETSGKEPTYDARMGLSESEWNEYKLMLNKIDDMEAEASSSEKVTVYNVAGFVSFKSNGKLAYLNAVRLDIQNKRVSIGDYTLPLIDTICVRNDKNVFKTAWRGYEFQFADPSNVNRPTNQAELAKVNLKFYAFTLGLFEKTGKTYIEISGSETLNGQDLLRYKVPFVIR